jgi:putative SOS response-associated peptidase YedK
MPVVLTEDVWDRWLDPDFGDLEELRSMLQPFDPNAMAEYSVSTLVNKVANNYAECIEPLRT